MYENCTPYRSTPHNDCMGRNDCMVRNDCITRNDCTGRNECMNRNECMKRNDCIHHDKCTNECAISIFPDHVSVAMAYIPFQTNTDTYEDIKALERGTLFPVLDKPFYGGGNR